MDVSYINPFIIATRDVFSKMIHLPLKLGSASLRKSEDKADHKLYDVSALICLSGAVDGLVILHMTRQTALALVKAFTGESPTTVDANCMDALGEIVSMIAGGAKKNLPGGLVKISMPQMLRPHQVVYPSRLPIVDIPFHAEIGTLLVEVGFQRVAPLTAADPEHGARNGTATAKSA